MEMTPNPLTDLFILSMFDYEADSLSPRKPARFTQKEIYWHEIIFYQYLCLNFCLSDDFHLCAMALSKMCFTFCPNTMQTSVLVQPETVNEKRETLSKGRIDLPASLVH